MKKKYIIMLCVLLVAVIAAAACIIHFLPEKEEETGGHTPKDYSIAVTNYAQKRGSISKNEILLLESSTNGKDGNLIMSFRIYIVDDGYSASYFMGMSIAEAQENPGLTLVGNATASALKGDPNQIFGLNIFHDR